MRFAVSLLIILLLFSFSIARNSLWRNDTRIWSDSIAKSPGKYRSYNELALDLIATGNHEQAYKLLLRSLKLNPYQEQVYINLGLALEHLGRHQEAARMYEQSIWLQPSDPTAYYNLGVLHYRTYGNLTRALEYFLQARDLDPLEPDAHEYLTIIYDALGKPDLAQQERILHEQLKHRSRRRT